MRISERGKQSGGMELIEMLYKKGITAMKMITATKIIMAMDIIKARTMMMEMEIKAKERDQNQGLARPHRRIVGIEVTMKAKVVHCRRIERDPCRALSRSLGLQRGEDCRKMNLIVRGRQQCKRL
jgi:hypothetical protein